LAESFPIVAGAIAGVLLARTFSGARLGISMAIAVLGIGFSATVLSGEWLRSWGFVLVDVLEAAASAILGSGLSRVMRSSARRPPRAH
jgi:hypothetical protein